MISLNIYHKFLVSYSRGKYLIGTMLLTLLKNVSSSLRIKYKLNRPGNFTIILLYCLKQLGNNVRREFLFKSLVLG